MKSKNVVLGLVAHVDSGKTTLSESILYVSGKIRKMGRVDDKDAYLDTFELEKARGITIFSKQALFELGKTQITLIDTPGHVDFSAEMERTLQVLDYAVLVISGADGVQAHTRTLWRLLDMYQVSAFIFINKMDQGGTDKDKLIKEIKEQLNEGCIEFEQANTQEFYEQLAMCDEALMEAYLKSGSVETEFIAMAVKERKVFPCFFGSALKLQGIEELLKGMEKYILPVDYSEEFGAKIFKITRDEQGNRLTHMKLTGGRLRVKDVLVSQNWEEKVNQIRIYSGKKFDAVNEIEAGYVCAVTGLNQTKAGEGLGIEEASTAPELEPVLFYQIILPEGCDPKVMLPKLRLIEEEEPELHIVWDEQLQELQVQIMGEVQIEILKSIIQSRFGISVDFDAGRVLYKETIAEIVEGVGHFEPLRHYAEVHLLLEPGEPGSGLVFESDCSEELLSKNWQRLVLTHLEEKSHKGVLTGSPITDMKITLVSGRAHIKHTEGGDFREATYRAVRQGLMEAESILLEPYYDFQLELPEKMVGRAMNDIDKMHGTCQIAHSDGNMAVIMGSAPVTTMRNYQMEVIAYSKGLGRLFCSYRGYERCHNEAEIIESIGYDPERDIENPSSSVFCSSGSGFLVEWDKVKEHMHVESYFSRSADVTDEMTQSQTSYVGENWISQEEIEQIFNRTFYANQGKKSTWKRRKTSSKSYYEPSAVTYANRHNEAKAEVLKDYLLVDGYNVIYAWPELNELADKSMDSARIRLLDTLCNYQGVLKCEVIVVFDAYRVQGHQEEVLDYHNIRVVYTKEAQTADQYIEKFAYDNKKKYAITVATSDGLQQIIIRGAGASLLSARELKADVDRINAAIKQRHQRMQGGSRNYIANTLSPEAKQQMNKLIKGESEQ